MLRTRSTSATPGVAGKGGGRMTTRVTADNAGAPRVYKGETQKRGDT
jgi:hypothetical protein